MLSAMFSGRMEPALDQEGYIRIDRDGRLFSYVLNFLRDGHVALPEVLSCSSTNPHATQRAVNQSISLFLFSLAFLSLNFLCSLSPLFLFPYSSRSIFSLCSSKFLHLLVILLRLVARGDLVARRQGGPADRGALLFTATSN